LEISTAVPSGAGAPWLTGGEKDSVSVRRFAPCSNRIFLFSYFLWSHIIDKWTSTGFFLQFQPKKNKKRSNHKG
jgi:hypothetical protein